MRNQEKWIVLILLLTFTFFTNGCSTPSNMVESSYFDLNQLNSATTSVVDDSITSTDISISTTYSGNNECSLDEWFVIEVHKNNKWYTLPYINQGAEFIDIGYMIDESGTRQMDYNWREIYGALPTGDYRIITKISEIENNLYKQYYVSTPFTIK